MFQSVEPLSDKFSMGELVDNLGHVSTSTTSPIHISAPAFIQLDTQLVIFETWIKVVLAEPYRHGEKFDYFGELEWVKKYSLWN